MAQCTAGKNFDKIKKRTYEFKIDMRSEDPELHKTVFLERAQDFMAETKEHLTECGAVVPALDEVHFWDDIIK